LPGPELVPLHIPLGEQAVAKATSQISFAGNLDVRTAAGDQYSYEQFIFDSLGRCYFVEFIFSPTAVDNTWTCEVLSEDLAIGAGGAPGGSGGVGDAGIYPGREPGYGQLYY